MCERSLCRPGYAGPLLNVPSAGDSFYFPSLRAGGSPQLAAALPALSYPRSPLAWTPPAGHAFSGPAQPPPYLAAAPDSLQAALRPAGGGSKEAREGAHKYYPPDAARKPDERGRQSRGAPDQEPPGGLPATKGLKHQPRGLPEPRDVDSAASAYKEELKQAVNGMLQPAAVQLSHRPALQDGLPWCPTQGRARKKRKPYTKQQIAELESEFVLHEFINRQKRKELSNRLHLSDQQVKIWFQNRRMKKKRVGMREQALALY
ncbi:homeobox protein Hox-D12 [Eublepharis macularius]|uniref:Homeobox protein Hox-D12 n=1 Tax=Eublepharis macularius TaxID=481883 RepID=A0AA97IZE1_EUBMA|nr:homeobox protein Hox-D12 [Eublepharis macularius]